jgi:hypothetical protein
MPRGGDCEAARVRFAAEHQAKYPKAVESLSANWERLVSFFDFPAEHWKHLRTTNVIESAFATVRLRERVTKGAGSRTKGLLMAFRLLDMAQQRWRRLDGAALLPPVRAGVKFRRWSSEISAKYHSNKRSRATGSRLIMQTRSTTIDNYSGRLKLGNWLGKPVVSINCPFDVFLVALFNRCQFLRCFQPHRPPSEMSKLLARLANIGFDSAR